MEVPLTIKNHAGIARKKTPVRGNGEFIGWDSVKACLDEGFMFTFGNKRCDPLFPENGWYQHVDYEYNEYSYQPMGWKKKLTAESEINKLVQYSSYRYLSVYCMP